MSALPSGDHIASEGRDRTLTTKEGHRYHSTNYGPWNPAEPLIDFGDNSDVAHPQQPDLFGGEL